MNIEEAIKKIKEIIYWSNGQKAEYIDISFCTYDDEINCEEFIEAIETVLNELDKKDKVIDMMAEYIEEWTGSYPLDMYDWQDIDCEKVCDNSTKQCWIEYFYKLVEGNIDKK